MQAIISKTGFFVSLISYLVFWGLDALRPGFVARTISVHLFLLCTIVFGIWWTWSDPPLTDHPRWHVVIASVCGLVLSVLVWQYGDGYQHLRVLVTLVSFFIPLLILRLVKYK